jgi:hypothetical protein
MPEKRHFVCGLGYFILEPIRVGMRQIGGDFEADERQRCRHILSIARDRLHRRDRLLQKKITSHD